MTRNVGFGTRLPLSSNITMSKLVCLCLTIFICKIEMIKYLPHMVVLRLKELLHIHLRIATNSDHIFVTTATFFITQSFLQRDL